MRHHDPHISCGNQLIRKLNCLDSAISRVDYAVRKCLPDSADWKVEWTVIWNGSSPILNRVLGCVRIRPGDLDAVDELHAAKVHHDPLGMECIVFTRKSTGEVWITFPVGRGIAIR